VVRDLTKALAPCGVVVTCALALVGIGAASGAASTPVRSATGLASIKRLSAAQFAALERVFVAAVPLDKLTRLENAPQSKLDAATKTFARACNQLSTRDPLLRPMRAGCPAITEINKATTDIGACSDTACLRRAIKAARAAMRRVVSGSRTSDRAANATHLSPSCKRALVAPPKSYTAYDQLDAAFGKLDHALAAGSADELSAAEAALTRAEKVGERLPTAKRLLALFRSGCR
jgi:hypothetical protein